VLRRFALSRVVVQSIAASCVLTSIAMPAIARTRPHYGGILRVEVDGDPLQRDGAQRPVGIAWPLILDGLTRLDTQGEVRPSLAVRWASENNNHRWQFWLRPGVNLQDNRPLTALSVASSITESCRIVACPWNGVHVAGYSIVITSDTAISDLPALLAGEAFLIQQTAEGDSQGAPRIVGTGPFRIQKADSGNTRLEANDDCWQGRPFVDGVELITRQATVRPTELDTPHGPNNVDIVELRAADLRQAVQRRLNVLVSPAETLLALEVRDASLSPLLRTAIAMAVDRAVLYQVIFQKQGEVTASLLPNSVSGYSFLFPIERDLTRAQAQRGGITPHGLTLAAEGTGPIQLAAERLALNLRDAGFAVKIMTPAPGGRIPPGVDLVVRQLPVMPGEPATALNGMLRLLGQTPPAAAQDPTAIYNAERDFLNQHTVIPLLFLPRAWAVGGRMRDLHLTADGVPDLANASLEGAS
jgi:peptide/nickel transport system substrate-binding protein